jgi:hypothetical protein
LAKADGKSALRSEVWEAFKLEAVVSATRILPLRYARHRALALWRKPKFIGQKKFFQAVVPQSR